MPILAIEYMLGNLNYGEDIMSDCGNIRTVTVGIPVRDLINATVWYKNVLGARREIEPVPGVKEFELIPNFWLQLIESSTSENSASVIRVGVDNLEREYNRLKRMGIEIQQIQEVPKIIRYFEFDDQFGNRLSFYELL